MKHLAPRLQTLKVHVEIAGLIALGSRGYSNPVCFPILEKLTVGYPLDCEGNLNDRNTPRLHEVNIVQSAFPFDVGARHWENVTKFTGEMLDGWDADAVLQAAKTLGKCTISITRDDEDTMDGASDL
ncbi:hypothetical protein C8R44DRAFT_893544 [Mycena epipterygia]|nr:hypothetical protein C8R44DRAFT_893544 [Mycena epipterygia]